MADTNNLWPGWETVRLIGRGSFGAVYEIRRDMFGDIEKAALKVISIPQNDGDVQELYSEGYDEESVTDAFKSHLKKIIAEYSLMRKMNGSANVVNCDDVRYVQHDDGIGWDIFIKMELLTPLTAALPKEIPEETTIRVAKDICAALELCRKHNIIHRDIKPQNIFYSDNGDYKLGDFGIAKTVEKTMGGTKTGTYKYMAPEVYSNRPYGVAADIYSLGLVLYWMLNERRMPFLPLPPQKLTPGMDEEAKDRRFSGEQLPPPAHGSEALKAIVLKACAFDPKDRYTNAGQMLEALNGLDGRHAVVTSAAESLHVPEEEDEESTVIAREDTTLLDTAAKERAEAERKTREEAARKAKAEAERKAREKAEAERRAREQINASVAATRDRQQNVAHRQEAEKETSRKGKFGVILIAALLALTIGCLAISFLRPRNAHAPDGPVDITLTVWTASGDQTDENAWLIQMERIFAEEHPEYNITWKHDVCSEGDAATMVVEDPANAADVFMFSNDGLNKLVDAGALVRLGGSYLEQVQSGFSDVYVASVTATDGGVYGFPMTPNTWFMYYNKSILSEKDVQSLEACLAKGEVAFPVDNAWYLPAFFFANGCTLFGEGGNDPAAGVQLGGEAGCQAALRVAELVSREPNFKVDVDDYGYSGLCNGTVAAFFSGSWDYNGLYAVLGDDLGVCPPPTVVINGQTRQLKAYAGTKVVGVNPNCENPEAAMEFAAFLASYDSQLQRFFLRGISPALAALADHEAVCASMVTIAEIETMRYAAFNQPTIREMDTVWMPMGNFGRLLADGAIDRYNVEEFLEEMVAAAG